MSVPLEFDLGNPDVRDAYKFAIDCWNYAVDTKVIRSEVDESIITDLTDTFGISDEEALLMSSRALQDVLELKIGMEIRTEE